MSNSDWATEAFGSRATAPAPSPLPTSHNSIEEATAAQVGDLIEECEYVLRVIDTNECRACENWFYGDGLQCVEHGEEAAFRRSIGDTDWPR